MKTLTLNLKKDILIIEAELESVFDGIDADINKRHVQLICKGSELTEEICETLISKKDVAKYQSKMCGLKLKDGLIKMIESKGCKFDLNKTLIFEIL